MATRAHKTLRWDVQMTQQGTKVSKALEKALEIAQGEINAAREEGVGLLTPELIGKHIRSGQELVLQYGQYGAKRYTLKDLKKFDKAIKQREGHTKTNGVPLMALERISDSEDITRSKFVRNATLYKIDGNILFFRVTGNSKPQYQVRIQLEEWQKGIRDAHTNIHTVARKVAEGRISFDCQCGRHQYWYRYLACIGGFALDEPAEQDFPKIRNPGLKGCCCKHVLKVLRVLKSLPVQRFIVAELEKGSKKKGFGSSKAARLLEDIELKALSRARGVTKNSKEAQQSAVAFLKKAKKNPDFKKLLDELKPKKARKVPAKVTPKPPAVPQPTTSNERKVIVMTVKDVLKTAKSINMSPDSLLDNTAKTFNITRESLNTIMKEENLS